MTITGCLAYAAGLAKCRQYFAIDKIEKPLRRSARFLLTLFPLLHRRLADAKHRCKDSLADMVSRANSPYVLGSELWLGRQTKRINFTHGDLSIAPALNKSRAISFAISRISLMIFHIPDRAVCYKRRNEGYFHLFRVLNFTGHRSFHPK